MEISKSLYTSTDLADVFGALAHPLRLEIMRMLTHRPMCVSRLTAALKAPQPSVSRALAILRRAGLVTRHRCGAFVRYQLAETLSGEPLTPLHDLIASLLLDTYDDDATNRLLAERGIEPPAADISARSVTDEA